MKHHKIFLNSMAMLLLFALLSGCGKTYRGEGEMVADIRDVGKFDKVALNMNAIVTVTDTTVHSCTVKAQPNILEAIITRLDGNTLVITSKGTVITDKPVEIALSMSQAAAFEVNGSGEIRGMNTLKNDELDFEVNGSGKLELDVVAVKVTGVVTGSGLVTLTGSSNDLDVEINGSGTVDALRFSALRSKAKIAGSGDAKLLVEESLEANVSGSGIVSYRGEAVVKKKISGSGEVRKIN
jgi:Putative auto-transporter adhesin, head GIN domain